MKRYILPNGLTVLYSKKKGKTAVVQAMVKGGSVIEKKGQKGISHLIEHLALEGTEKRPNGQSIANEIESLGGEFNAYTAYYRTAFYAKILNKHFDKAVEIIADVLQNPLFREKDFKRERGVVLKEIDMVFDDPRYYQWVLFQRLMYKKHPCKTPTYGDKKELMKMTNENVKEFFYKYYHPSNMVICVVGDLRNWKRVVRKYFGKVKKRDVTLPRIAKEKVSAKKTSLVEKRKTANSYLVMGFPTVTRDHKDSYVLDVIQGILGRGQSGKIFAELRGKHGLAYEVGAESVAEKKHGYFAAFASFSKKNRRKVEKIMLSEFKKLYKVSEKDVAEAKTYLEGEFYLTLDDAQQLADTLLFWEGVSSADNLAKYNKEIKKVTVRDVRRVAKKYFTKPKVAFLAGR